MSDSAVWSVAVDVRGAPSTGGSSTRASAAAPPSAQSASWETNAPFVYVGLKRPGAARGWWRGQRVVDDVSWLGGRQALASQAGVAVVAVDSLLPMVTIKVRDVAALGALRRLPFVDYVEPALAINAATVASGCDWVQDDSPWTTHPTYGDRVPESYTRSFVDQAWGSSTGAGEIVGLTDTGVDEYTPEIMQNFATGWSTGRWFQQVVTGGSAGCSHGTRVAGVIAAPMNGVDYAGVAWRANLFSVRQSNSPAITNVGQGWVDAFQAIRDAGNAGSRVISMPWAGATRYDVIEDEITRLYYNQDVVFVGAAGTSLDVMRQNGVLFPANKLEVLAVSAANMDGQRDRQSHYGPELDLVAFDNIGTVSGDVYLAPTSKLEHSSAATALVTGVAALVRARFRTMPNYQVYDQLRQTAGSACGINTQFSPVVNALAAVGGFCGTGGIIGTSAYFESSNDPPRQITVTAYQPTGGNAIQYEWDNGSVGPTRTFTIWPGPAGYTTTPYTMYVDTRDTYSGQVRRYFGSVTVQTGGGPPPECGQPGLPDCT